MKKKIQTYAHKAERTITQEAKKYINKIHRLLRIRISSPLNNRKKFDEIKK